MTLELPHYLALQRKANKQRYHSCKILLPYCFSCEMIRLYSVIGCVLLLPLVESFTFPSGRALEHQSRRLSRIVTAAFTTKTPPSSQQESSGSSSSPSRWDDFDYLQHWYPVSWVDDLKPGVPEKLSLFDVDYAVAHDGKGKIMAFMDQCPHRQAALSEGRLTETGYLQCAYHGWSFDTQGTCVQIPQSEAPRSTLYSPKSCATAVPARIHQDLIWLWPGPVQESYPDPPSIPEMDDPTFKVTKVVRDFPMIDYSLLVSNILDPDHGLFAHQSVPFDMYVGSKESPLQVQQEFTNQNGWILKSSVPAVAKMRKRDEESRENSKKKKKAGPSDATILATSTFWAPSTVSLCRRDANGDTKFVTAFWVVPTGTGKSRFLSAGVGQLPFQVPRWIQHVFLNAFLDQDSVLVASQQPPVLQAEARQVQAALATPATDHKPLHFTARSDLFCYQSPTDKAVAVLDQFWDATLPRAPNRIRGLLALQQQGALQHTPHRTIVLDRETQHLNVCPDSQGLVRNCRRIQFISWCTAAAWFLARRSLPKPLRSAAWPGVSFGVGLLARRLRQCFYYSFTKEKNHKKLATIPKVWRDPE